MKKYKITYKDGSYKIFEQPTIEDNRLSPMTYKKLKELGYSHTTWKDLTQEQANKIIANKSKSSQVSSKPMENVKKSKGYKVELPGHNVTVSNTLAKYFDDEELQEMSKKIIEGAQDYDIYEPGDQIHITVATNDYSDDYVYITKPNGKRKKYGYMNNSRGDVEFY